MFKPQIMLMQSEITMLVRSNVHFRDFASSSLELVDMKEFRVATR